MASPQNEIRPRVLGVIPARLASTRLPRKVLRDLAGKLMVAWVYEAARACPQLDELVIATDHDEVLAVCRAHGWPAVLTSPELASGTDRVHAVSLTHPADIYVNIQGDEPLLRPDHLTALLAPFTDDRVRVATLKVRCSPENVHNPNAVKVVTDLAERALYFSRSTIPYRRDLADPEPEVWKHLGFYAYRAEALNLFQATAPQSLELAEKLEQLRFLALGVPIHVAETPHDTVAVDVEADLLQVDGMLRERSS